MILSTFYLFMNRESFTGFCRALSTHGKMRKSQAAKCQGFCGQRQWGFQCQQACCLKLTLQYGSSLRKISASISSSFSSLSASSQTGISGSHSGWKMGAWKKTCHFWALDQNCCIKAIICVRNWDRGREFYFSQIGHLLRASNRGRIWCKDRC